MRRASTAPGARISLPLSDTGIIVDGILEAVWKIGD